jgi:anti-anti-sigma factor
MADGAAQPYAPRVRDEGAAAGPGDFEVEVWRSGATAHVTVRGELDLATSPQLQQRLDELVSDAAVRHVVLDLRLLDFIDSTGITLIYRFDRLARQDGFNAALVRGGPSIQRVFTIAGLADHLVFVDAPDDLAPPPA